MKTIYRLLKYNRILKSHRIKYADFLIADVLNIRHWRSEIDLVNGVVNVVHEYQERRDELLSTKEANDG